MTLDDLPQAPPNIPVSPYPLREYQDEGIEFLRNTERGFLYDQPRLGKTAQAVMAAETPVLIACPKNLIGHWQEFLLECKIPQSRISVAQGTREQRQDTLDAPADWHICNIEMMRKWDDPTERYHFQVPRTFIVDESHHLRGHRSMQSRGAYDIANGSKANGYVAAKRVYLLTGTPVCNRPDDLFSQLKILDPKRFTSYWDFIDQYCKTMDVGFGPQVVGSRNPAFYKPLHDLFAEYSIGRTAKEVGLKLSPLTERMVTVTATSDFYKQYRQMRNQYVNVVGDGKIFSSVMEASHALRKLTVLPKLKPLLDLMHQQDMMHSTTIFCKYKLTAKLLASHLNALLITGEMNAKYRRDAAQHPEHDFIVATMDALSEGVDMRHIRNVIFFELDHVPAVRYQALSRNALCPHPRTCYYIVVRDTIDEKILKANTSRTATIRDIVREALTT